MDRQLTPISKLRPNYSNFIIYGQISFIKSVRNASIFKVTDSDRDTIKCVAFGATGDWCNKELKLKQFCYVLGGKVQPIDKNYNIYPNDEFEIIISNPRDIEIKLDPTILSRLPVTPIENLKESVNYFKIHGRVTLMDTRPPHHYQKRFNFEITDFNGDTIACSASSPEADVFYQNLVKEQSYYLAGGHIKKGHEIYNQTGIDYQIDLNNFTIMEPAPTLLTLPKFNIQRVFLSDVANVKKPIDVLVCIKEFKDVENYTPTENKPPHKRHIQVIDDSKSEIRATFWGYNAVDAIREEFLNKVVAFKGVIPTEGNGQLFLSITPGTRIVIQPEVDGAAYLEAWFDGYNARGAITTISQIPT